MNKPFSYKKLLQYLLQGLLILAPLVITAYAIFWVVSSIDSLLPIFTYKDAQGNVKVQNYGIGFIIIIGVLIIIGYFSSFFITGRVVSFVDKILEKTPGIKYIYSTTVLAVWNRDDQAAVYDLDVGPEMADGSYRDALSKNTLDVRNGKARFSLDARKSAFFVKP